MGVLTPADAVAQQEGDEPVEVFRLPRPEYDPLGVPAGGFRIYPSLTVSESFEDNVFAEEEDTEGDFVTTTTAAARVMSNWSAHGIDLRAFFRDERYFENSDQNQQEYGINPRFEIDVTRDSAILGSAAYRRDVLDRSDPNDLGQRDPTEIDRYLGDLAYVDKFNRLALEVDGKFDRRDYVDDNVRDRNEFRIATLVGYEVGPALEAFVEPFGRFREFDERNAAGLDRDATIIGATVGARGEVTRLVGFELGVGAGYHDFADPAFDDTIDLVLDGELSWYVTPVTTVKSLLSRRDIASDQPGASSRTETLVAAEVQHQLRHNVLLGLSLAYINDDFRQSGRDDDRAIVRLEGRYLLNRYFSIVANYRHEERWSTVPEAEFSRNIFTIGLRGQL